MLEKHKRFAEEYIKDFNASAAARRAGYSKRSSRERGHALLNHSDVQGYLGKLINDIQERNELEVDDLVQELKKMAFADMGDFFDEEGQILPIHDIPKEARAALEIYQDDFTPLKYGSKVNRKVKLNSKLDAIEKLMRYLGAYEKDNRQKSELDITNRSTDELMAELASIRKRRNEEEE